MFIFFLISYTTTVQSRVPFSCFYAGRILYHRKGREQTASLEPGGGGIASEECRIGDGGIGGRHGEGILMGDSVNVFTGVHTNLFRDNLVGR